jgi:membrane-bound ClpP family serine protease
MSDKTAPQQDQTPKKKAGVFDIRFVIGGLLGAYGIILILLGLFNATDEELARGDGLNINLWGGIGMLVVAIGFGVWARLRPVVVPTEVPVEE